MQKVEIWIETTVPLIIGALGIIFKNLLIHQLRNLPKISYYPTDQRFSSWALLTKSLSTKASLMISRKKPFTQISGKKRKEKKLGKGIHQTEN